MQWQTQAGNITTNFKVTVYLTLPTLLATNFMTCKSHVDYSAKGRYNMILGKYLLTELGLNLKFSEYVLEANDVPFKESTTSVVDLGMYVFKYLNIEEITPEG